MPLAILLIAVGGVMVYTALTGVSIVDFAAGVVGDTLNPSGGKRRTGDSAGTGAEDASIGEELAGAGGGAKTIVSNAAALAIVASGGKARVSSDIRPGATTSSGNVSDHSQNNASRAARDIAIPGVSVPTPEIDRAAVAVGKAFGRNYASGQTIMDSFEWNGYQIQIIWRTADHRDHLHVGAHKL